MDPPQKSYDISYGSPRVLISTVVPPVASISPLQISFSADGTFTTHQITQHHFPFLNFKTRLLPPFLLGAKFHIYNIKTPSGFCRGWAKTKHYNNQLLSFLLFCFLFIVFFYSNFPISHFLVLNFWTSSKTEELRVQYIREEFTGSKLFGNI